MVPGLDGTLWHLQGSWTASQLPIINARDMNYWYPQLLLKIEVLYVTYFVTGFRFYTTHIIEVANNSLPYIPLMYE